ncbi:endonuclease domain-containing protein [Nocardioides nematodiphilus]|uniref:endonuclease domain-containing protein n=1 Tax=Nocardioides nematodiphilus TaxID=2849669 RepID=UPI001CD9EB74|nr:endonuclease domain-containing protein [Nocardioides nematodiphilus]MCA1982797.1 endonuclease domain-containing protein [Nocardioides nematodiphilus]
MTESSWRDIARAQCGLITRAQLASVGIRRSGVSHRIASERWQLLSATVIATTTGELTRAQRLWHAVLHAGDGALAGGLTAAEDAGLRNWSRETLTVFVPYVNDVPAPLPGISFVRSRRDLGAMRATDSAPPAIRIEPAILLFASADRSERTAQGVVAAAVQQQHSTPDALLEWIDWLRPLRRADALRRALQEIAGGAQSVAELDIRRFCRRYGFAMPRRQVKRSDASGRVRYTDCEWDLPGGVVAVLEIDGSFHMEVEHWEDDIARQRALTSPNRLVIRCTARELREDDAGLARDLRRLGVPRAA